VRFLDKIIFTQDRVGMNGRIFRIYKIRTMKDGKITKIGRFLRRWRLDELLQLVNVLKGDMNLVGPRPLMIEDHNLTRYFDLPVKPGITGLWQIRGCKRELLTKWDFIYYERRSLWLDLWIIMMTPVALLKRGLWKRKVV